MIYHVQCPVDKIQFFAILPHTYKNSDQCPFLRKNSSLSRISVCFFLHVSLHSIDSIAHFSLSRTILLSYPLFLMHTHSPSGCALLKSKVVPSTSAYFICSTWNLYSVVSVSQSAHCAYGVANTKHHQQHQHI